MARLLMLVLIPAHLFYMGIIYGLQYKLDITAFKITIPFVTSYLVAVIVQLLLLLYLAYVSVFWAWKRRINPDNSAIPFTSALADVFGNCLMAVTFLFLKFINDENAAEDSDDGVTTIANIVNGTITTIVNGTVF